MYFGVGAGHPDLPGRILSLVVGDAAMDAPVGATLSVLVVVESDLAFTVSDDGVGAPVDRHEPTGQPLMARGMKEALAGGWFRGMNLHLAVGLCTAVVVDTWREGRHYRQWADWEQPAPPLQDLGATDKHGTRVRCHLDAGYFGAHAALPTDITASLAEPADKQWLVRPEIPSHVQLLIEDQRLR